MRVAAIALLALLVPVQGAFAAPPPVPKAAAWIVEAPGHGGVAGAACADVAKREIASLTKLMTAHLVLRYTPLGFVAVAGPMPSRWASRACRSHSESARRCRSLLAALIVHSANDAAIVLAHATMDQPAAQAAATRAAQRLGRPCRGIRWRASSCS